MAQAIPVYKKKLDISYTIGAFATIELLLSKPEKLQNIFIHPAYKDAGTIKKHCENSGVPYIEDEKVFKRISQKENVYVAGVFNKYTAQLDKNMPHLVLVNPSDMGNLGTIIRISAAFNILNLAIITPAADIFNPKVIRSSMGALFRINFNHFSNFEDYAKMYKENSIYPFMLQGDNLSKADIKTNNKAFSLVFGNEATGLEEKFIKYGTPVKIPQSNLVDSLNLSVAAGIGCHFFAEKFALI